MNIFETLTKLKVSETSKRKEPCYIFRDEVTNQIKEVPLSKVDSAGALISEETSQSNKVMKKKQSPAQLIHDSIFGK